MEKRGDEMLYNVLKLDEGYVLKIKGDCRAQNAQDILHKVESIFQEVENVDKITIDMTRVSFMDSTGLGAFILLLKRLKKSGGILELTGLQPQVRELFKITRLDKVFKIIEVI